MSWVDALATTGDRLRKARKAVKLSAAQVAERAGLSESTVRALENGQNKLRAEQAAVLAPILKTTPAYILFAQGDPTVSEEQAEVQQLSPEELRKALRLLKAAS